MPDDYLERNDVYDVDGYGPRLVYIDLYGQDAGFGQVVWLVDLQTGERRALNEVTGKVRTLDPSISGDDVVWSADRSFGNRLDWQIVHHDLSSGTSELVDEGVNRRKADGTATVPVTDLDDGLVAYTVESATDDWPDGRKIIVRRLADRVIEREIQTRYPVWYLAIDDGNVAYSEVPPEESGDETGGVMLSTTEHPEPVQIAPNGSDLRLDGRRIVWAAVADFVVNAPVVEQAVFTATLDDLTPIRLSRPVKHPFGGRHPAAGDGLVVWSEPAMAWDNLFMWDSRTNQTYQIAGQHDTLSRRFSTYLSSIGGGWLAWSVTFATDTETLVQFAGLTTDDLTAAVPLP